MIECWFDGVCEPRNPGGHAAWGAVVHVDGVEVYRKGGYCGVGPMMSNNVAEYSACIAALTEAKKHKGPIVVRGDSRLVICQLDRAAAAEVGQPQWQVRGGLYKPFYLEAKKLYDSLCDRITMHWIPREENDICDVLSKKELHDRGVVFRIQPE
jgi:ribonuclease HI